MSALLNLKYMSRQLFLFTTIALICIGVANVPAYSKETNESSRDGYPEKVVPGGTYLY